MIGAIGAGHCQLAKGIMCLVNCTSAYRCNLVYNTVKYYPCRWRVISTSIIMYQVIYCQKRLKYRNTVALIYYTTCYLAVRSSVISQESVRLCRFILVNEFTAFFFNSNQFSVNQFKPAKKTPFFRQKCFTRARLLGFQ